MPFHFANVLLFSATAILFVFGSLLAGICPHSPRENPATQNLPGSGERFSEGIILPLDEKTRPESSPDQRVGFDLQRMGAAVLDGAGSNPASEPVRTYNHAES